MDEKKVKLRPGQAKVQFLACKEEVISLIEKGHSMAEILEILTKKKKLNISYYSFRDLVLEHIRKRPRKKKKKIDDVSNDTVEKASEIMSHPEGIQVFSNKEILPSRLEEIISSDSGNKDAQIIERDKGPRMIGSTVNTFIQTTNNINRELETKISDIKVKEGKN